MSPQISSPDPQNRPRAGQPEPPAARGRWLIRDLPVIVWLVFLLVVIAAHPGLPVARWLMIHLLVLGAASHSILVWSKHFAEALLHTPSTEADRRGQSRRLILLNGGTLIVIIGMIASVWTFVLVGAAAVAGAVIWHGLSLWAQARTALASRFASTLHYYLAAAAMLPIGVALGVILAFGVGDSWHSRLVAAHALINLLGWIGLTVLGTLVTLWPTMLRTKIVPGAEVAAKRALPILSIGLAVTLAAALLSQPWAAGIGLIAYLGGIALVGRPFFLAALAKPPREYPTFSAAAAMVWLVICLFATTWVFFTSETWTEATQGFTWLVPALAAGFAAQILFGALSYLLPVVLGGGPNAVRAATMEFARFGTLRITIINVGLAICLLPVPSWVRVLCSGLVALGLAAFLPLVFRGIRASRRAKKNPPEPVTGDRRAQVRALKEERAAEQKQVSRNNLALAAAGLSAVLLAVAGGVAIDPASTAAINETTASAGAAATGETTHVRVEAKDMRFTPATVDVPTGDRLIIDLKNLDDEDVHDLVLATGQDSGRLAPGESTSLDVGIVGEDNDGWCSIAGHRQMGMVFGINVTGGSSPAGADSSRTDSSDAMPGMDHGGDAGGDSTPRSGTDDTGSAAADVDFLADPGADFSARDSELRPTSGGVTHKETFTVSEVERTVAADIRQKLWLFNKTMPGPTLRGDVGDVFVITLVNDGSMGHSIDFHAGELAPDKPMRTIPPGESLTYTFKATHSGIWMYHCATMPMSSHIANGMFGAVIIDPPDLPAVDKEFVLVQSELYLGPQGGVVDSQKVRREEPDAVVFNGFANQYDHDPLTARTGERVRFWILNVGPNRSSAFHIIGGQFDTVYKEGAYLIRPDNPEKGASQVLDLETAQGGFVELEFAEEGHYPFVSHKMVDAERGAHGIVDITG
ncbi:multicopper oxidase domain-containing protein [Brevibacterium aurantiacum]|uniref:multicopper oxidase domain-containing protein n=1 Tax=Brevibacterium aurantiacum TaxID=273384 RepID=UPI000F652BA1|nr:multicopper oxidase domain-containing protein [Brevibacterium aurantiacum]AZL10085.1 copper oxidase [Brevibacterium aurantiacum]